MMDFEDQLRNALARQQPSAGFAERVSAEAARRRQRGQRRQRLWRPWAAGCVAASLFAGALGLKQLEHRFEREKGESARAQLLQALRITGTKLHHIQQKIESAN